MKKIKSLLLSLLVAVSAIPFSTGNITASAYSNGISTPHDILSDELFCKEVDYSLWDNFIRYDLCINDYDSLTDKKKELCKFIFETERSAAYTVRCERARRIVDGEDVGERVSLDDIIGAYGIWNKYAARKDGNFKYIQCVPDIVATDSPNIYNEYWFDDEGKYGVRFKGENGSFSDEYDDFVLCGDYIKDDYIEIQNKYNDVSNYDDEYCYKIDTLELPTIVKYDDKTGRYLDYTGYVEEDGNYYYITDENTAVLVGASVRALDEPEAPCEQPFELPAQVNGCDVVAIAKNAFDNSAVTEIILPDSLKFIETYAFYNCRYLEKINVPQGLEYIGSMAFTDGADFSNLYIDCPNLYIAPFAFYSMQNLKEAYINAKIIGEESFGNCLDLKKLEFGKDVQRIEAKAFFGCSSIENLVIPSNVKIIGVGAFAGNTKYNGSSGIKSVTISAETEIIGAYAEALGSPDTSGIPIDPVDPLTEEPVCAFDADCIIYGYANSEAERYADEFSLNFNNIQEPSVTTPTNPSITTTTVTTTSKPTTTTVTTTATPIVTTEKNNILGNVNGDDKLDVRDCAFIASALASGKSDTLPKEADFNGDGKVNVRDAAAIASFLAKK